MENAAVTREEKTLTQRILEELAERGPGAEVRVKELAIRLGEYEPGDPRTGQPPTGDAHRVRQVVNRLSRAAFADSIGFGPLERYSKEGPYTIYAVSPRIYDYMTFRDDLQVEE